MKKFLRHSWPVLVIITLELSKFILRRQLGLSEQLRIFQFIPSTELVFSLFWIYYLKTSPFTQAQNTTLIVIIILRLIAIYFPFDSVLLEGIFKIGMEVQLIIFYIFRTKQKEIIRIADKAKLVLVCFFFANSGIDFIISKAYREVIDLAWDLDSLWILLTYLQIATLIFSIAFITIHIFMLLKWSDHYKAEVHNLQIDQIGK